MGETLPTLKDIGLTCLRWGTGLIAGSLLGLIIALFETVVMRSTKQIIGRIGRYLSISLDFLRSLPIIALVPIVQMFGVEEAWKIGIIAWAVMFPVWISVRQARIKSMVDTELVMLARGIAPAQMLRSYHFPKALAGLLRGVEISIGVAWLSVVAAEWVGTFSTGFWAGGLGYKIIKAHDANSWKGMFLCLALFGVLGSMSAWLLQQTLSRSREWLIDFNPMYEQKDRN